jgi:hypothetical protein
LLSSLKKSLFYSGLLALAVLSFAWSAPAPTPWHGLTAVALVSSVLGVSVLRGLALHGLVPRLWAWAGPLLLVLLVAGSVVTGGLSALLRWIDNWPQIILFGVAASWPVLAIMLTRRWLGKVPQVRTHGAAIQRSLWRKVKAYNLRYTPLTSWAEVAVSMPNASKRSASQGILFPVYLPYIIYKNGLPLFWGKGVPIWQLWLLGLMAILASNFLICKDLHWRMLLAPAGMRRGTLGWHIAFSTATVNFVSILGAGVIGAMVFVFLSTSSFSLDLLTVYLAGICIVNLYLIFAISVATLIRGTQRPRRWAWGLGILWGLVGIALVWNSASGANLLNAQWNAQWFTVGYPYVFALLVLSALAVWAANRLWTVDKLLRCAPK